MSTQNTWVKQRSGVPDGFFFAEANGLAWLREAQSVEVVEVVDVSAEALTLRRVAEQRPTAEAAADFGAALAKLHSAGAQSFGQLPPQHFASTKPTTSPKDSGPGPAQVVADSGASMQPGSPLASSDVSKPRYFFGPLSQPLTLPSDGARHFGQFYSESRLRPLLRLTAAALSSEDRRLFERLCGFLESHSAEDEPGYGELTSPRPARAHGDLWSGNVLWSEGRAILIDPAACGHHRLADLAMLDMFGFPHQDVVFERYEGEYALAIDWRDYLPLHQLFGYLVHLELFGTSYLGEVQRCLHASASLMGI